MIRKNFILIDDYNRKKEIIEKYLDTKKYTGTKSLIWLSTSIITGTIACFFIRDIIKDESFQITNTLIRDLLMITALGIISYGMLIFAIVNYHQMRMRDGIKNHINNLEYIEVGERDYSVYTKQNIKNTEHNGEVLECSYHIKVLPQCNEDNSKLEKWIMNVFTPKADLECLEIYSPCNKKEATVHQS